MHRIVDSRCVLAGRNLQESTQFYLDQLHQELSARGAQVIAEPENEPWGLREFSLRTPDGHRIRFGEPIPAS